MICTHCGLDLIRYQKMDKVVKAAENLISEGKADDNMDGVVEASDKLLDAVLELHNMKSGGSSEIH